MQPVSPDRRLPGTIEQSDSGIYRLCRISKSRHINQTSDCTGQPFQEDLAKKANKKRLLNKIL